MNAFAVEPPFLPNPPAGWPRDNTLLGARAYIILPEGEALLNSLVCTTDWTILNHLAMWMEDENGRVHFSRQRRKYIRQVVNRNRQSISLSLTRLKKAGVLVGELAEFFLHPACFKYIPD